MKVIHRLLPTLLVLLFGGAIVLISLLSANHNSSQGDGLQLTHRKLYFQAEVLPDHLLYPVFAGFDRIRLMSAKPPQTIDLEINYAWRRLEYTHQLLDRGYQALSFSTLTKAFKYYNTALAEVQNQPLSEEQKENLRQDARDFHDQAKQLEPHFTDTQQQELMRLEADQIGLIDAI